MTANASTSTALRHEHFYAAEEDSRLNHVEDMVIIQVENCLFRVSASQLSRYSPIFADMFSLPHSTEDTEGRSDETPIRMEGVPMAEFEQYLHMACEAESNEKLDIQSHGDATDVCLARLAAVARWDASDLQSLLKSNLVQSDDPILQLLGARQLEIQHWIWPTFFRLAIIPTPPTADLRNSTLSQLTKDVEDITQLRAMLDETRAEMLLSPVRLEMYLRRLIEKLGLAEPSVSDITPPRSGYRIPVNSKIDFPTNLSNAPFSDSDHTPIYVGTYQNAVTGSCYPGKVRIVEKCVYYCLNGIEQKKFGRYQILPLDTERMEWVPSSRGAIPEGQKPVWGGWDAGEGEMLYHAFGHVHGVDVPGMTSQRIGAALLSWNGSAHRLEDNYHILMWKKDVPLLSIPTFDSSDIRHSTIPGSSSGIAAKQDALSTESDAKTKFSKMSKRLRKGR